MTVNIKEIAGDKYILWGASSALYPQFTLHLNFYPADIPRVGFVDWHTPSILSDALGVDPSFG